MNNILATEKGLPPGLWLPGADEPTELYLTENMRQRHREGELAFEDIVDYASLIVALAFYDAPQSGRVSMMPTSKDFRAMFTAGYGLNWRNLQEYCTDEKSGSVRKIQKALNFSPQGDNPSQEELVTRFKWVVEHAYPLDNPEGRDTPSTLRELLDWSSARKFTPAQGRVLKIFNGDTTILQRAVKLERSGGEPSPRLRLYRFGARVLKEEGGSLTAPELDKNYKGAFSSTASNCIERVFGNYRDFWLEFDIVQKHSKFTPEKIVELGTRWRIENDGRIINSSVIKALASASRFPVVDVIYDGFGGISNYQREVDQAYAEFLQLEVGLTASGVAPHIIKLVGRSFERGPEFSGWIDNNIACLVRLSNDGRQTRWVIGIMEGGFDLLNEDIFQAQLNDVVAILRKLGLGSEDAIRLVFDLTPRIDYEDVKDEITKALVRAKSNIAE